MKTDHDCILTFLRRYGCDKCAMIYFHTCIPTNAVDIFKRADVGAIHAFDAKSAADDIKVLMHYVDEIVGPIMITEFVSITTNQTVKSAL